MMKANIFALLTVLMGLLAGCSSELKEYNPKMGLLDELAEMEPANHRWSARAEAPQPVAVEAQAQTPAHAKPVLFKQVSLRWPLQNIQITSAFGQRGREFHEGVDLRAASGTPVYAAHSGQVLYASDRIHGYGNMVVIKHSSGISTIYAHNSRLAVRRGQWVPQGALIAFTGNTGHSHGPHLHFEVRNGVAAVNPLSLLPKPPVALPRGRSARNLARSG